MTDDRWRPLDEAARRLSGRQQRALGERWAQYVVDEPESFVAGVFHALGHALLDLADDEDRLIRRAVDDDEVGEWVPEDQLEDYVARLQDEWDNRPRPPGVY